MSNILWTTSSLDTVQQINIRFYVHWSKVFIVFASKFMGKGPVLYSWNKFVFF